ncbi:MAG: pirin family protein [Candidatus Margulisiibacteriota bacterium]|nr:MAG: hypothetical protein A2X43_08130 [Candidatus Margulisbacteria bacterium GWD2_39_127]OGI01656.1 MAG: hypothetical protein A2X42_04850 [Candidatus Margulisbacteria bacterium GWF2_38_17]OGI05869.1 MAG: hypothetical protein A2X41_04525 [Candidatus Margulisbacteria bacterium GWE2_39_32]PZM83863.1 MAG: pirin family protein [Candidatus Margulisiibacteriota bacterium]HAR63621.1 hypothetical protein [Candidatus Margulisiibacteriota bacterium]
MRSVIHRANTRGEANYGWLHTRHTFSFAAYYNPKRMQFGALRVLNDDLVAPGAGFELHPHENMEIITIPLFGTLEHQDDMGNLSDIRKGEIQIMSAGTGIRHEEYNQSQTEEVKFLQIWILPRIFNIKPRYDQKSFNLADRKNRLQLIVSPEENNESMLWINQDAYVSMGNLDDAIEVKYEINIKDNCVYLFVIDGNCYVGDALLNKRDGLGICKKTINILSTSSNTELLLIEVPKAHP